MTKRQGTALQRAWWDSARWRQIGSRQCQKLNAARALLPRCDATAKQTGLQCEQPAMKNGKCRFHGGRTPAGNGYRLPVLPKGSSPCAVRKAEAKLRLLNKRSKQSAAKRAAMTPEQLARNDAHRKSHMPGPASKRRAAKLQRQQSAELAQILNKPKPPLTGEALRLQEEIARIDRLLFELNPIGVFA